MTGTLPLRRFARLVNGGTPTAEGPNWGGDVQWATPIDLARVDGGFIAQTDRTLTPVGLRQGSASVPPGSILISSRAPIGYTAVTQATMAFNQGCKGLVPLAGVDARYLRYWLSAQREVLQAAGSGSTFMELNTDALMRFGVPNRTHTEQRRIADFLDDQVARIDNIMASRRRQSSVIRERSRAARASCVEADGTAHGWIPFRRWITAVDQGWSPQCDNIPAAQGEPGVLKLSAVRDGRFNPAENKAMLPGSEPDPRYRVRAGDLLISRANTPELVGDSAVVSGECRDLYLPDLLYRVALSVNEPTYVCGALRTARVRGLLRVIGRGTSLSMAKIRGEDIRALPVPAAPLAVRVRRATEFDLAEHDLAHGAALLALSVERLDTLKRSLITTAVTGEFDVSTADGSQVLG